MANKTLLALMFLCSYALSPSTRTTNSYVRKNQPFLTNKANFQKVKLNVTKVLTKDYDKKDTWWSGKNKANSKPNKANFPVFFDKTNPIKPNLSRRSLWRSRIKPNFKGKTTTVLQLIKRIWCYKATVVFTKNNVKRNCFFIKSLQPVRKHSQSRDVDFLQHRALIHIRVVFRKVETKLKAYVYGWPDGLFLV